MSDFDELVGGLRTDTAQMPWPEAADVRRRGDARTRRRLTIGAVALVTVAALGGAYAFRGTATPPPQPAAPADITLDSFSAAPSGLYYAVGHNGSGYSLLRSTDNSAEHWTRVSALTGIDTSQYLALITGRNGALWLANGKSVLYSSADDGANWSRFDLGADPTDSGGAAIVDDMLWFSHGGLLWQAQAGATPKPTPYQPSISESTDPGAVHSWFTNVVALSETTVIVRRQSSVGTGTWLRTLDRGEHWSQLPNPCFGFLPAGSDGKTSSAEGSLWTVCFTPGGAAPGWQISTSTDEGDSWTPHPGDAPGGDDLWPTSATVAWRTGHDAGVYRTTDAANHWTQVATIPADDPITCGAVVDDNTAVYVTEGGGPTLHITHDGGQHWTTLPLTF